MDLKDLKHSQPGEIWATGAYAEWLMKEQGFENSAEFKASSLPADELLAMTPEQRDSWFRTHRKQSL